MQFGESLRDWRSKRRMSQLDLGLSANVSARHISFLETGRSRPSRSMVLTLCEELDVPRPDRNHMLTAAGFAPLYKARNWEASDMEPARAAMEHMLTSHAPYPGLALDRHWRILRMNAPAERLFGLFGIQEGDAMLEAMLGNATLLDAIENLPELALHLSARLRTESAHLGGDAVLEAYAAALDRLIAARPRADGPLPAFVPTLIRLGDARLSFLSTIAQFGSAEDIALAEIRVELMFPADDATRAAMTPP
ncbi:helix-turn-helix domain-containing protein [Nioella aestuarii]|uniref:helix-turn-helix domain-containing protein n=1 Tax=Nioella aestuarii TaxID=1662864 RepID=UPI003D7FEDDF